MNEFWNGDAPGYLAVTTWFPNSVLWVFIATLCLISAVWNIRIRAPRRRAVGAILLSLTSGGVGAYFVFNLIWREEPPAIRMSMLCLNAALLLLAGLLLFLIMAQMRREAAGRA